MNESTVLLRCALGELYCVYFLCWLVLRSVCSLYLVFDPSADCCSWVCIPSAYWSSQVCASFVECVLTLLPCAYLYVFPLPSVCSLCLLMLMSVCSPCLVCAPSAYWCSHVCASLADRMVLMRVWSLCWLVLVAVMWNKVKEHSTESIFSPLLFFF